MGKEREASRARDLDRVNLVEGHALFVVTVAQRRWPWDYAAMRINPRMGRATSGCPRRSGHG